MEDDYSGISYVDGGLGMYGLYGMFARFTPIAILLQLALIVHAYRNGKPYYWYWVLLVFPFVGGAAYLFLEVLPEYRSGNSKDFFRSIIPRAMRVKLRQADVDECDTVEMRESLANELRAAGRPREALEVLEKSIQGVFREDADLLYHVADLHNEVGEHKEALALLATAETHATADTLKRRIQVAQARAHLGIGERDTAYDLLKPLETIWSGEEVRYHLAMINLETGQTAAATQELRDLVKKYGKGTRCWRLHEKKWYHLAKAQLARLKTAGKGR